MERRYEEVVAYDGKTEEHVTHTDHVEYDVTSFLLFRSEDILGVVRSWFRGFCFVVGGIIL